MVTTINNNTIVVNEFPSNQIVSLFKHATIWDRCSNVRFIRTKSEMSLVEIFYVDSSFFIVVCFIVVPVQSVSVINITLPF
jgi:hypothetical protein